MLRVETLADPDAVAERAAHYIADEAEAAVRARGLFALALSGGQTPRKMLHVLAGLSLPWDRVHIFQVDERVAPTGDPDRNLAMIEEYLAGAALPPDHVHGMPVEAKDLAAAALLYAAGLEAIAGSPPVLDLVHLGLGADGHTASLVPGDPALNVADADVALAGPYQGRRRMTLALPLLDRARQAMWIVTGADKAAMLARLLRADWSIPAGRVRQDRAIVFADRAATAET